MILTRQGNKRRVAKSIIPHFPKHDIYIEPFFGAGGMFFSKPKAKYNLMNDLDDDVFNLFIMLKHFPEELKRAIITMPVHETLFHYWKKLKVENDRIYKAVRFLFLSNFSYLSAGDTFSTKLNNNAKNLILERFSSVHSHISDVTFTNSDFRYLFSKLSLDDKIRHRVFIYADPPYIKTNATYRGFTVSDAQVLIETLLKTKCKFCISEFDSPEIETLKRKYSLSKTFITERQNLKNRRIEIILTNYRN